MSTFTGSKKKQGGGGQSKPDTFFTEDSVEVVLGLGEGPIEGLKDSSAVNFFIGDTPLISPTGQPNFENFELVVNKGSAFGELIVPKLGGASSSITVNTELSYQTPVVRQGQQKNIDWLELRWSINALYKEDETDGPVKAQLQWFVEYKPASGLVWMPAVLYADPSLDTQESAAQTIITQTNAIDGAVAGRRQIIFRQDAEPVLTADQISLGTVFGNRIIWLHSNPALTKVYRSGGWFSPEGMQIKPDYIEWTDTNYLRIVQPSRLEKTRRLYLSAGTPSGARIGDLWRNLWFNGAAWVELLPAKGEYDPLRGETVAYATGVVDIKEKISSTAVKELRLRVARIDEAYQVRVTKLTKDSNSGDRADITWESISEINSDPLIFPNLATVHLTGRASDQFSSIPDFWGIYRGRVVRVPSNYDPIARTYEGVWDGTWKIAWTNNPAFVGYDLVMNDRYGINSAYPVELDPFDVYEAGQWCDVRVGQNKRPQFTFNGLIAEPRGGREAATYIFGIFGGRYFDDGNGYARLKIDKDDNAVHLFTKENVENGLFTYAYTAVETRKNDYTVAFVNPDLAWKEDRRRVFDQQMIDTYGRVPEDFIAVGCTNEEEAIARARLKMISDATEDENVSFTTNRAGLYLEPYDIILVADDGMDEIVTGRITGHGANYVLLRDAVYLEAGFAHKLVLTNVGDEGFAVNTLRISPSSIGISTKRLNLLDPLPAGTPDQVNFSIDSGIAARPYRVMRIDEDADNVDKILISAQFVNRNKWTQVHDGAGAVTVEVPHFETSLGAVSNLRIEPRTETVLGRVTQTLGLSWDPHPNKFVRRYEIYWRYNDGSWVYAGEQTGTSFDLADVRTGHYTFSVRAISFTGQKSIEAFADIDLRGVVREVPKPVNLRLVNAIEVVEGVSKFEGTTARFEWEDERADAGIAAYDLEIRNHLNEIRRTEAVSDRAYTYDLARLLEDGLGRRFSLTVRARDVYGNQSEPVSVFAFNPPPRALTLVGRDGTALAHVSWDVSDIPDYVGALLWVSEDGIDFRNPPTYDIVGNSTSVPFGKSRTLSIAAAGYDAFGKTELIYSSIITVRDFGSAVDTEAPETPTGLTAMSGLTDAGLARIVYSWLPNEEDDLAGYQLEVRQINADGTPSSWDVKQTIGISAFQDVYPGETWEARLLAYDRTANKSNYCDNIRHTAIRDTAPPGMPTKMTADTFYGSAILKWTPAADRDLAYTEIYYSMNGGAPGVNAVGQLMSTGNWSQPGGLEVGKPYYFWFRSVDTSGNKSNWTERLQATPRGLSGTEIQEGFIATELAFVKDANIVSVTASKLKAGEVGAGIIKIEGRDLASVAASGGKLLYEDMSGTPWGVMSPGGLVEKYEDTKGELNASGTYVLKLGRQGLRTQAGSPERVAYDPTKLHKITFRVAHGKDLKQSNGCYFGLMVYDKDGNVLKTSAGGTEHWFYGVQMAAFATEPGWTEYTGFFRGRGASPFMAAGTVAQPRILPEGTVKIQPTVIANNEAAAGVGEVLLLDTVTIETLNEDVVAIANAGTSTLLPGVISLEGPDRPGSFTDWRRSGTTEMDGQKISANTISGETAVFGLRGIDIESIQFEHNKPSVNWLTWTGGTIRYRGDDGNLVSRAIDGNSNGVKWTGGTLYVIYIKGRSALDVTGNYADANMDDRIILAKYRGDKDLNVGPSQTKIDGANLKTGSVGAEQIDVVNARAALLIAGVIKAGHIDTDSLLVNDTAFIKKLTAQQTFTDALVANTAIINTLKTAALTVGNSPNLLVNSDFATGSGYKWWIGGDYTANIYYGLAGWTPIAPSTSEPIQSKTIAVEQIGYGGTYYNISSYRVPVIGGKRYQASLFGGLHRCNGWLTIQFFDGNGTYLAGQATRNYTPSDGAGGGVLSGYFRPVLFLTAPSNAAFAQVHWTKAPTLPGQQNSYCFLTRFFFGEALDGQTEPSAWEPAATTTITGDLVQSGQIRANNGKMVIDLDGGTISIYD